eukprot:m.5354 g.5354  ORF g.5354 m.5354 type:complete len:239 (+) comp4510_c0_seq1:44-760(+)
MFRGALSRLALSASAVRSHHPVVFATQNVFRPTAVRYYAEKKSGKKGAPAKINFQDSVIDLVKIDSQMKAAVESFKEELTKFRVGRVSAALLDGLQVTVNGAPSSLAAVGQVAVKDASTLVVTCFDPASALAVEQAVKDSPDLKLTPAREGNLVKVALPKMTKEHREGMVKQVKATAENLKVRVRRVRQKGVQLAKDAGDDVSRDDKEKATNAVQTLTDTHCNEIDALLAAKVKELLG